MEARTETALEALSQRLLVNKRAPREVITNVKDAMYRKGAMCVRINLYIKNRANSPTKA